MPDQWGRPTFEDWMHLTQGIENIQDIQRKTMDLTMRKIDVEYRQVSEKATIALAAMAAAKNPDGSIRDKKAYYAHFENLISVWDHINTERDFVPGTFSNMPDGEKHGFMVDEIDHTTGQTNRVPVPSEDSIKELLGNYYSMKGGSVGMTDAGFQIFTGHFLATMEETKQWNANSRANAEIFVNDAGDTIRKYRVRDGKGDGRGRWMYENESDKSKSDTGDAGLNMLITGGYRSTSQRKAEAVARTAELEATKTGQDISRESIAARDRLKDKRVLAATQEFMDSLAANGISIDKNGQPVGDGGLALEPEQQTIVNKLRQRMRKRIAADKTLIDDKNITTEHAFKTQFKIKVDEAVSARGKKKGLVKGISDAGTYTRPTKESPLEGTLGVEKEFKKDTRKIGEYGGIITATEKVVADPVAAVGKGIKQISKAGRKFWEEDEQARIEEMKRRGL